MKIRSNFNNVVDVLGAVIFSVITLVCFAQIINRYFFGRSFVFAEELAVQLMIWIAFLGAAKCVYVDAHTRLTFGLNMLTGRARIAMLVLCDLLSIGFLLVAAWYGIKLVQSTWRATTTGTHIPEGLVYLAMPLGSAIMIVFLIANSIDTIRGTRAPTVEVLE